MPKIEASFRFNYAKIQDKIPTVINTSNKLFKADKAYNIFYKHNSDNLGILIKENNKILVYFSDRGTSDGIGLSVIETISKELEVGSYIIDAKRREIIFSWEKQQITILSNFSTYPTFHKGSKAAKTLILREDKQKAIFVWGNSPIITLGYFTTTIQRYIKPSNNLNTLRGLTFLVELLYRQNQLLIKPTQKDIENFLHLLKPSTIDWGITREQTYKILDLIMETIGKKVIEKEENLNTKVSNIMDAKKNKDGVISLTTLISEGFSKNFDEDIQTEIILDIKLEGIFSGILEMFTQGGVIFVYTHNPKEITAEKIIEELSLPVDLENLIVLDYMDLITVTNNNKE